MTYEARTVTVPLPDYLPQYVDIPRIAALCAPCPHYGKGPCCPPFDFDPMALWGRYRALTLYARRIFPQAGMGGDAALAALEREKAVLHEMLLEAEALAPGSLALSPGRCTLCPEGCPGQPGAPCRRPGRMRYSLEALGADVARTAEDYLGWPLLWISGETVPAYLTLVGGLLTGGAL